VKSSVADTANEHGVRQVAPFEVRATAPGGVDSIVKVAPAGEISQSKPGMFDDTDEQLASARLHTAAAIARDMLMDVFLA